MARFTQSRRQGEGQGRRREAGSEGSAIRNGGAMNKQKPDRRRDAPGRGCPEFCVNGVFI